MVQHADIDHTGIPGVGASGPVTSSGLTMATARLLGRTTASTGAVEEITVGSGLSLAAGSLTATGGGGGGAPWRHEIDPFVYTGQTNFSTRLSINQGGSGNFWQYLQSGGSQNDVATYEGISLEAGTYAILAWVWKSNNHGIIHVQLDGTDLTTIDLYNGSPSPDQRVTATGLTVGSTDVYQLGFKMASKNASSSNYFGLIAKFVLYRTA